MDETEGAETISVPKKDFEIMIRQAKAYQLMLAIGQAQASLAQIEKEIKELTAETGNL